MLPLGLNWDPIVSYLLSRLKKSLSKETAHHMPAEVDVDLYQSLYDDLAGLDEEQLFDHYAQTGRREGRRANGLLDRGDFASLITPDMRALEIGPFSNPVLNGPRVSYCDILDQAGLQERATRIGYNPDSVPHIDYVLGAGLLDEIPAVFDAVLSSHSIEHQPDLVRHLQQIERRLNADTGRYFVLAPDKRYCFDRFIAPSTVAEVLQAHHEKRTVHTLRSIIEHNALTTHNDGRQHWDTPDQPPPLPVIEKILNGLNEWKAAGGGYVDVHAWYFTPESFSTMIEVLNRLNFISLSVERLYETRYGGIEFWAILKKSPPGKDKPFAL